MCYSVDSLPNVEGVCYHLSEVGRIFRGTTTLLNKSVCFRTKEDEMQVLCGFRSGNIHVFKKENRNKGLLDKHVVMRNGAHWWRVLTEFTDNCIIVYFYYKHLLC